jgi:hypothetical protein
LQGAPYEDPTPLNAPGWFDCFDAPASVAEREIPGGVDGRVYGWPSSPMAAPMAGTS